jgi:molybdenum-dependent DNA-binding transcriptional regulator ModE
MRRTIVLLALLLAAVALTGTACGSSDDDGASSAEAAAEIDQIKTMLDEGLAQYRAGDEKAADTTVGDAYLEHFEEVEDPLGERDHEFMEELEHRISTEIRDTMKDGAPEDEVAQLIDDTKADLDTAKTKLQEAE